MSTIPQTLDSQVHDIVADLLTLSVKQASEFEDVRRRHNALVVKNRELETRVATLTTEHAKQASVVSVLDDTLIENATSALVELGVMPAEKKAACAADLRANPNLAITMLTKIAGFVQPHLQAQGATVPMNQLPKDPTDVHSRPTPWYT